MCCGADAGGAGGEVGCAGEHDQRCGARGGAEGGHGDLYCQGAEGQCGTAVAGVEMKCLYGFSSLFFTARISKTGVIL